MKPYNLTLCIMLVSEPAMADYFNNDMHGDILNIANNAVIANGAWLDFNKINVSAASYIQNKGIVSGDMFVSDGLDVYIKNSGRIDGEITLGNNASLTQVIHTSQDITSINVNASYNVAVYHATDLQWTDVQNISGGADKIILIDSDIVMSPSIMLMTRGIPAPIELVGHNNLYIKLTDLDFEVPIFWRTTGNGTLHLHADEVNPLYALRTEIRGDALYAKLVRETDYYKILNNDIGRFLNIMRETDPTDSLLHRLDSATTMSQLYHIMNKSMRINTRALAYPLQTFNKHINMLHRSSDIDHPLHFAPFLIAGHSIDAYGMHGGIKIAPTKAMQLSLTLHAADMNFTDGIDNYSAQLAGAAAYMQYDAKHIIAESGIITTLAKLTTPALLSDTTVAYAPSGFAANLYANAGPKFLFSNSLTLAPLAGIESRYADVIQTCSDISLHAGLMLHHAHQSADFQYTYNARLMADNIGGIYATLQVGLSFPDDDAAVLATIGAANDDMGMSYSLSVNGHFGF